MPQATAAARTDLTDHNRNPSAIVAGGQTVTLILTFDSTKVFVAEDLWDALITKYGAGKVTGTTDMQARNVYRWTVTA
jgi:hypothetical protein